MSALSTPSGGGTTTQNKPTSGKQKYQKLDINSLYCVNRNENSEPSSVKSQLSRKHGMQSLGKVPSARRPPANLPSLKTEIGQDSNSNSVSVTITTTTSTPASCTQTTATTSNSGIVAGTAPGGWVALPPPSSPHFRTEFPSLEAAAQPSHRTSDHSALQPQLRPQTEGSWTCGGTAGMRQDNVSSPAAAPASVPVSQQTPAFRAILPSFLMKGSSGSGIGLGTLSSLRDSRSSSGGGNSGGNSNAGGPRSSQRQPATPRAVEVLTARPILREEQISSLDDISRDAGWAQHDDIDYDQKLDFSDGESSTPAPNKTSIKNRATVENDRIETKIQEPGDEDQLWAERRQKQSNEVAQAVARARQRKEEEQRRQMRETAPMPTKDIRDRIEKTDRDRNDNRDRESELKEKDKHENRDRERLDNREKERGDVREMRNKERTDNRDNRDRYDNRDRNRDLRDGDRDRIGDVRERDRERTNIDNRDRDIEKERSVDVRDRERGDNRDRIDRDRFERERERERPERERNDREFRERDYGRDREQSNPAFSKTFQANIPPRFLKQQQNRQQDDQHKPWMFSGKQAPSRRQDPIPYNAPRHTSHNGRRSYSRDYSDREDDFRREKEGHGQQWRSEMQEYDRNSRESDRINSKDSYKDYGDYKDKKNEPDRKVLDLAEQSRTSAADKLTEVFERKSIALVEPFAIPDSNSQSQERRITPPSNISQRESLERDFSKASWAEVTQEEQNNFSSAKPPQEKTAEVEIIKDPQVYIEKDETTRNLSPPLQITVANSTSPSTVSSFATASQNQMSIYNNMTVPNFTQLEQSQSIPRNTTLPSAVQNLSINDDVTLNPNVSNQFIHKPVNSNDNFANAPSIQKQASLEQLLQSGGKMFSNQKPEKDFSETESVASKSSTDPSRSSGNKNNESNLLESIPVNNDPQKRHSEDKRNEKFGNEQSNKIPNKEPIERKSSGSGSEKRGRGYGSGSGGYAVYNRGWGSRESRGRRSHRSSRSNRGSESDGSTDGTLNAERKDRRRAPRSPRGPKKPEKYDDPSRSQLDHIPSMIDGMENREPFAPRGQPSRRGRGGFQGASRPPAPAKRVTGYGPPNTKSPFSQANRAVKETEEIKDNIQLDDKGKPKSRLGSSGRGRDRRPKGVGGPFSGEDENWETTSEHSEGGSAVGRHRSAGGRQGATQKNQSGRGQNVNNRQNNNRNNQVGKKDGVTDSKNIEITETMTDPKLLPNKKEEDIVDDGFQEVRNKKNSKEIRGNTSLKEDNQHISKQSRSHSNQSGGRNGSSSRNPNEKSNIRGSVPVQGKPGSQYDRPRQSNLPPRFAKQRQKQQMGLVTAFGPDTGAAPPPPPVNAWDKPISQTLRANVEEPIEVPDIKSNQSSQRSTPGEPTEVKVPPPCAITTDKTGVLDGTTPPVETIIFENTNFKTAPPAEALKQKYQPNPNTTKPQSEEMPTEIEARPMNFNGDVRAPPRSIQELIADNGRPVVTDSEGALGIQMSFDTTQKAEDSSDMKLDFAFDSDLGQLTEDKTAKSLGMPRGTHMSTSNTISPLAADLNLKIASVKKVWEMPAVAEGSEDLQFAGFEEANTETGAPPNVCKVKPTQQLQSPPPQHFNHVGYQGGYGGLSVPSPPAVLFNSSQQLLGSSQQMPQQGGLYGAFLDQSRGQFGGFPASPYGAGSAAPYNYQPSPDMFQSLPSQYRMAAAASGGGAAFGQSGQLGNSPNTVLISSSSNSLMSATVKPSSQQIGAIGSKGGGVGSVGGVNTYQQQYLGFSGPVGESPYSLPGLLPRPAPPANSYYSPYQPPAAPAPTYPLQFTQPAQSNAFSTQFLSSQLQVAAAVHQMQQQYRAPLQQQYTPPQPRPPPQQPLKSPLHEHANGFAPLCEAASPTPKGAPKPQKPPHSPPQHKYHAPPPHAAHMAHPPPSHTPHQHHQHQHQQHQQQMMVGGNNGRCGGGARGAMSAPRYPAPIQRPHAPAPPPPLYRAPPPPRTHQPHQQRPNLYYHHQQRNGGGGNGGGGGGGGSEAGEAAGAAGEEGGEAPGGPDAPPPADVKAE